MCYMMHHNSEMEIIRKEGLKVQETQNYRLRILNKTDIPSSE